MVIDRVEAWLSALLLAVVLELLLFGASAKELVIL
jgi:hypothetical protein